jgi:hypothetical protein
MISSGIQRGYLQNPPTLEEENESIFRRYSLMYDAFFDDVRLIPPGHFCEVRFENLEQDMRGTVKRVYEELDLPGYAAAEEPINRYITSVSDYKKNKHPELPPELRNRIYQTWERNFDLWHYPKNGHGT